MSALRSLLALSLLLACARAGADPAPRRRFYAQTITNGGYWYYDQTAFAERNVQGGELEVGLSIGGAPVPGLILAAEVLATLNPSSQAVQGPNQKPFDAGFGAGGNVGFAIAWLPRPERPPVELKLSGGFQGGGVSRAWGGVGPYVALAFTGFIAHAGRSHFGLDVRVQYSSLYSDDAPGAVKNLVTATAGFSWTFQ